MKISSSKERIQYLLDEYKMSQTAFCNKTKIQKSALSNYLNGERVPRQDQIAKIADAFGISASWLMGYDVPMREASPPPSTDLRLEEIKRYYNALNDEGRARLLEQAEMFYKNNKYKEVPSSRKETG